jgi:hypothetical protein
MKRLEFLRNVLADELYQEAGKIGLPVTATMVMEVIIEQPESLLLKAYREKFNKSFDTEWQIMCN